MNFFARSSNHSYTDGAAKMDANCIVCAVIGKDRPSLDQ
jgi:hypothetical protein